jgi:hypothetical protein
MHRRAFLSLCAAGSVAGCSAFGSTNHALAQEDATAVTDTNTEPYRQRLTLEFEIPAGEFANTALSPEETETLAVDVTVDRGVLDVWTLPESNYESYSNGEEVQPNQQLSATSVIGGATLVGDVEPGDHRVVFDNSPAFGSQPEGTVAGTAEIIRRLMPAAFFDFKQTLESNDITYEQVGASEDRAWWLVRYKQGADQSQREAALDVQDILLAYSGVVPGGEDTPDHRGLRVVVERPDADTVLVQAPAPLARRHQQGDLEDQEYFEEVQRTTQ